MKRFISIVLVVCLLPLSMIFSGCSGYNLNKLKSDFYSITSDCRHIGFNKNKLEVRYSDFELEDGSKFMLEAINRDGPYTNISNLEYVLDNSLSFVYSYVDLCSNNKLKVSKDIKNATSSDLKALKESITKLDHLVTEASGTAQFFVYNTGERVSLSDLSDLYDQYVVVIGNVLSFSKDLQAIYDAAILSTNIDLNGVNVGDFDTSRVLNYLEYIKATNIVDLTEVYYNSYLNSDELLASLTIANSGNYPQINRNYDNYSTKMNRMRVTIDSTSAKTKADVNKSEFLEKSAAMFNSLRILNNEYKKYCTVRDVICYADAVRSDEDMSLNMKIDVVEAYNSAVSAYSTAIIEVLNIIS